MQPIDWTDPQCPVARTVDLVGDRWSLLILRDACDGARSFTGLQRGLGVAKNILTDRLRRLVEHGLLARRPVASGKRHEYALTDAGRALFPVVVALRQWGEAHAFAPGEAHSTLVDGAGEPVAPLRVLGADGTELSAETTRVRRVVEPEVQSPSRSQRLPATSRKTTSRP